MSTCRRQQLNRPFGNFEKISAADPFRNTSVVDISRMDAAMARASAGVLANATAAKGFFRR